MGILRVICLECRCVIDEIDSPNVSGCTHGFCAKCLKAMRSPKYHAEQRSKGFDACFGTTAHGQCWFDREGYVHNCHYRPLCLAQPNQKINLAPMIADLGVKSANEIDTGRDAVNV
jgi:hypothetical protein